MHVVLRETRRGCWIPRTEVTGSYEPPCGCWGSNPAWTTGRANSPLYPWAIPHPSKDVHLWKDHCSCSSYPAALVFTRMSCRYLWCGVFPVCEPPSPWGLGKHSHIAGVTVELKVSYLPKFSNVLLSLLSQVNTSVQSQKIKERKKIALISLCQNHLQKLLHKLWAQLCTSG